MKTKYSITGMTCNHCVRTVEGEFKKLGISAKADMSSNSVELDEALDEDVFKRMSVVLEDSGYDLGNKI